MNEKFVTQLCDIIAKIGGGELAEQARPALATYSDPSDAAFSKALSYLNELSDSSAKYGVALPVTEYSSDFFVLAEDLITQAGNQLGFMTATDSGNVYPTTGIYWIDTVGNPLFYVIKIQEPAPQPHDSLESLFSDIADAIREVSGETNSIIADQFPQHIRSLIPYAPLSYQWDENTLTLTITEVPNE